MPKTKSPRKGSLQYWPRKRAKRIYARVRTWPQSKNSALQGFLGYKAGMTHVIITGKVGKNTQDISLPVTVIECPPIKIIGAKFYKNTSYGPISVSQILTQKLDKELKRKITLPKKQAKSIEDIKEFDEVRAIIQTQPKLTGIGKKKPEILEVPVDGSKEEKLNYIKENLGKEIQIKDIFSEGQQLDIHSITKGKGLCGPVKRFGIGLKSHKSEKGRRRPGNLGPWTGAKMWRVAQAGQLGFQQRTEHNKWLIKISDKPDEINPKSGFQNYGAVKNTFILLKGSLPAPKKRTIILTNPLKPNRRIKGVPLINYISLK